jgi:hypothetical protein
VLVTALAVARGGLVTSVMRFRRPGWRLDGGEGDLHAGVEPFDAIRCRPAQAQCLGSADGWLGFR